MRSCGRGNITSLTTTNWDWNGSAAASGRAATCNSTCRTFLKIDLPLAADLVFSVGLIEHFDREGTRQAVAAHFDLLKPGGIAVIGFPTPTPLYRLAWMAAELAGAWILHDERPLRLDEVAAAAGPHARLLSHRILWPIVFTQCLAVWRKHGA